MSKTQAKSADIVRVTSMIKVGEKQYKPNQLVKNLPDSELKVLLEKKRVSDCEAGIKYCKDELKAEVFDHTAKPAPVESEEK